MTDINIDDLNPRKQCLASAGQTVFTYDFPIRAITDIKIYKRLLTATPNDTTDILVYAVDYTLTGVGSETGGTFTLTVAAALDDVLTAERAMPLSRSSVYTYEGAISSGNLETDFDNIVMELQQERMLTSVRGLTYPRSAIIENMDITIPILLAGQSWRKNASNTAIEGVYDLSVGDILGTPNQIVVTDTTTTSTISIANNPTIPGNSYILVPRGTTAQRPAIPVEGMIRYDTDLENLQEYEDGDWQDILITGTGAPRDARYITQIPDDGLTNEQAMSLSPTGIMRSTIGTGVIQTDSTTTHLPEGDNLYFTTLRGQTAALTVCEPILTKGNLYEYTSDILTITGGTSAIIGTGTKITVKQSSTAQSGYLSSTDWNTFNDKSPAFSRYDLTVSGNLAIPVGTGTNALLAAATIGVATGYAITSDAQITAITHSNRAVLDTITGVATTVGKILRADGTNWAATTSTFADTYAVSTLLYASAANVVTGLATANSSVLVTGATGIPSFSTSLTLAGQISSATGFFASDEASYVVCDADANSRLGFVKKSGSTPQLAAGSATAIQIGHWSTTNLIGNIAAGTFTQDVNIGTTGNVTVSRGSLTVTTLNAAGVVLNSAAGLLSTSTALPNGVTATTQSAADNSTKLATTAYVDSAIGVENLWDRVTGTPNYVLPYTAADDIGATGARITKGWFTNLECTNAPTVSGAAVYYTGGTDVSIADGGTNSSAALANGKMMVSVAGAIVEGTPTVVAGAIGAITTLSMSGRLSNGQDVLVQNDAANGSSRYLLTNYGTPNATSGVYQNCIRTYKSRGTAGSPSRVLSGDELFTIVPSGTYGNSLGQSSSNGTRLQFYAAEDYNDSSHWGSGFRINLYTLGTATTTTVFDTTSSASVFYKPLVATVGMYTNAEDSYVICDNETYSRFGMVKKTGSDPCIAAGSGTPLALGHWSTTSLLGNIAGGTFTPALTLAVDHTVKAEVGLTVASLAGVVQATAGVFSASTALADGTTATKQTVGDNTTKVATDSFVAEAITAAVHGIRVPLIPSFTDDAYASTANPSTISIGGEGTHRVSASSQYSTSFCVKNPVTYDYNNSYFHQTIHQRRILTSSGFLVDWATATGDTINFWWKKQHPYARSVKELEMVGRMSAAMYIATWKFQGSNDDANWDDLYTTGGAVTASYHVYTIPITTPYLYHRILGLTSTGGTEPGLSWIQMYDII